MKKLKIQLGIFARQPNSIESRVLDALGYSIKQELVSSIYTETAEEFADTNLEELRQYFPNARIIYNEDPTNSTVPKSNN